MTRRSAVTVRTAGPDETRALGRRIAATLQSGDVVLLHGDLGAGKTTLAQGIAAGLGVPSPVQSPTFVLAHEHRGRTAAGTPLALHHLDLYRLAGEDEAEAIGYAEYLALAAGITVVEWPERAGRLLPEAFLLVELRAATDDERAATLTAFGPEEHAARWLDPFAGDGEPR